MQRRQKLILSFMVWGLVLFYGTPVEAALTPQEIHTIAERSTVLLEVIDTKGNPGMGSGFIVHDGWIATNYHVIKDMSSGFAKLVGKAKKYRVKVLVVDKERDLAIVKAAGIDAPARSFGDSDAVQVADKIYVMGNPQRLEGTFSSGEISASRPPGAYLTTFLLSGSDSWDWHAPCKLLQMTAPISKGSSGGPVLNDNGEVIGIASAGLSFLKPGLTDLSIPDNLNFAVAVNYLKRLVKRPITPKQVKLEPVKLQNDPPPTEPKPILTTPEIAEIALRSTVHLGLIDGKGNSWTGSGFVIHDGQIATNYHVINNMSVGGVRLVGKEEIYPVESVLDSDKEHDLAVIKVGGIDAPALSLGDSDTVRIGDKVYVAGNPQGLEGSFSDGIISAIRGDSDKFFQMTAPISQGSSGGPVFNEKGEVIGVSFATFLNGQNLNFAIPVSYLKPMIKMPIAPPIVKHDSPSRISVGEIIPLTLDIISSKAPQQVTIHYKTYDRNRYELEQSNRKMNLWSQQSASSTWVYKVNLPAQKHIGSIEYYIVVEYKNHPIFRHPEAQPRHYQISIVDGKPPTISLLYPPDGARFGANQEITVRAKVTDNVGVKDVHIHTSWFNSQQSHKLTAEGSSDIYTVDITLANIVSLRYYLTATDEEGNESRSESRHIEMKILTQENLEKGIRLYEQARYSEAIKALSSAVRELEDPKQRAEAYLYLGGAKRGIGEGNDKVREQFQESIRHNPYQELPPRLGKDHPIFAELIEEVRKELTGELTVSSLLPQTEIWIEGNNIDRKMLGTGVVSSRRLLTGDYIVEGIYAEKSQRQTITIEPNRHKVLDIGVPPTVEHDSPPRISIGERIPLTLDLMSTKSPQQVKIYYKIYGRDNNELEQSNRKMKLWSQQSGSSTWVYKVDLPAQKQVGSIEYYIEIEYDNRLVFKYPSTQSRHYQISIVDENPPIISLLYPPDGAKFKHNQEITIRAEVRASFPIKAVHVHFSSSSRQEMSQENSSDVYTTNITVSQPLRYYLIATDEAGNTSESESRRIEIQTGETPQKDESDDLPTITVGPPKPSQGKTAPPVTSTVPASLGHQGIWASISTDDPSTLNLDENYMFRLAYLREGKNQSTLGAQMDFFHPDRTSVSAMVQWGLPALGESNFAFTLLGGIARYKFEVDAWTRLTYTTPILGAGLKFYPHQRIAIDATSSFKVPSDFDTTSLYHYEVGIRFYITRDLSLRAGYGQLYLGDQNVPTIQVGLGYTF